MKKGYILVDPNINAKVYESALMLRNMLCTNNTLEVKIFTTTELLVIIKDGKATIKFKEYVPDFIIMYSNNVAIASIVENSNIQVINSAKAIEYCSNKLFTSFLAANNSIIMPDTVIGSVQYSRRSKNNLNAILCDLGGSVIVKTVDGSENKGVFYADSIDTFDVIVNDILEDERQLIYQKPIMTTIGRDMSILVAGSGKNAEVVGSLVRACDKEFRTYMLNEARYTEIELNEEVKKLCINIHNSFGMEFSEIQLLFGENEVPLFCEISHKPALLLYGEAKTQEVAKTIKEFILNE